MKKKHLTVITHDGVFHADEVFAVAAIKAFSGHEVVVERTRSLEDIEMMISMSESNVIVVDVGGVYDPAQNRYDHHQRSYRGNMSSFGMVWRDLVPQWLPRQPYKFIQENLVEFVDAADTGRKPGKLLDEYKTPLFINGIISSFNGCAGDDFSMAVNMATELLRGMRMSSPHASGVSMNVVNTAMSLAWKHAFPEEADGIVRLNFREGLASLASRASGTEARVLARMIQELSIFFARMEGKEVFKGRTMCVPGLLCLCEHLPLASLVMWLGHIFSNLRTRALRLEEDREQVQEEVSRREDPNVLVLPHFMLWQSALEECDPEHSIQRVCFPGKPSGWRVQARAKALGSFELDKPFPQEWCGLSGEELSKVSGLPLTFCHRGGFILGTLDKDTAVEAAKKSLG